MHPEAVSIMIKKYYRLTKPGIIYGNLLTTIAGFLYGSGAHINVLLLAYASIGTALVIASACVFNNYIDRDIDAIMQRTSKRAIVSGAISARNAIIFAGILGAAGVTILSLFTNLPTLALGLVGFVSYIGMYTPSKRKTEYSTLIGSISGATPIAAGYTAAAGRFDVAALFLFLIMVIWQMPHFYAISIFRKDEYAKAKVPILSVVRGISTTKKHIISYIVLFMCVVLAFPLLGYTSFSFFVIMAIASGYWLWRALQGLSRKADAIKWSRQVFGGSLLILLTLSLALSIDYWLP